MKTIKTLRDLYIFSGFRARSTLKSHSEDPNGYIITLERRQKKQFVHVVVKFHQTIGIEQRILSATLMLGQPASTLSSSIAGLPAGNATP